MFDRKQSGASLDSVYKQAILPKAELKVFNLKIKKGELTVIDSEAANRV